MKNTEHKRGDAYAAVRHVYDKSPGRSWSRLNAALQETLSGAIAGHLSFEPDDFSAIANDMHGAYWLGNGSGALGERYYTMAVRFGHTPACISFERYADRPPALWSEKVKSPGRLFIGEDFTWQGMRLTVTNMMSEYLVACSYGDRADEPHVYYENHYRRIEHAAPIDNGCVALRVSAPMNSPDRKPERIVKIKYAELAAVRKAADKQRKDVLSAIADVKTFAALAELTEQAFNAPRGTFRHFDIEDFRKALAERRDKFGKADVEAEQLQRWLAGGRLTAALSEVRLRVNGEYVETSTGHSVSLSSARRALPAVMQCRRAGAVVCSDPISVDIHTVNRISPEGVRIGCTLIPWSEVDRLAKQIGVSA